MTFKIPVMSIQDVLANIDNHSEIGYLKEWIEKTIEEQRGNWGIKGKGYKIDYDLELQWYPIFIFTNRWLANFFVLHLCTRKYMKGEK